MYRKIDETTVSSGTSPDSWAASSVAGTRNLSGLRAGTPGAATPYTAPEEPTEPEPDTRTDSTCCDSVGSHDFGNHGRQQRWSTPAVD